MFKIRLQEPMVTLTQQELFVSRQEKMVVM